MCVRACAVYACVRACLRLRAQASVLSDKVNASMTDS